MKCIFCEIIAKQSNAEILFENEKVISILDINPLNYGHSLVFPKIHVEDFLAVPEEYLFSLIKTAQQISKSLMNSFNFDGFNIVSNNGKVAGQSVFHCHFHIIPRFIEDGHRFKMNLKKYNNGEMKNYAEKIRSNILSEELT